MVPHARGSAARQIVTFLGLLAALVAFLALMGHAVVEDGLAALGLLAALAALIALAVMPAGTVLGSCLRPSNAVDDRTRAGAVLAASVGIVLGWSFLHAQTRTPLVVGGVLLIASVAVAILALRPPLPRAWRPPDASLGAFLFLLIGLIAFPKFEGPKPHAYYLAMRRALEAVAAQEAASHSALGRYTADLDTARYGDLGIFRSIGTVEFTATDDGYRAMATTNLSPGRCAVFVGGDPIPPATTPGVVACTPYPERDTSAIGTIWLLALLVTAAGTFWLRPAGRSA